MNMKTEYYFYHNRPVGRAEPVCLRSGKSEIQISGRSNQTQCCHRCEISSNGAVLPRRNDAEMAPQTRHTLRRNTASIMEDLI